MARSKAKAPERVETRLSPQEVALIERLVEAGALLAVPQLGSAKPRKVITAALDPAGDRILLYLSAKPATLPGRRRK